MQCLFLYIMFRYNSLPLKQYSKSKVFRKKKGYPALKNAQHVRCFWRIIYEVYIFKTFNLGQKNFCIKILTRAKIIFCIEKPFLINDYKLKLS